MSTAENNYRDSFERSLETSLGPQLQPLPSLTPLNTDKRSALPRGCRFRDLGEAHRNITGRSISASYGASALTGSFSSSTNNTDTASLPHNVSCPEKFSLQDMVSSPNSPFPSTPRDNMSSPEDLIDEIFGCKGSKASQSITNITPVSSREFRSSPPLRLPGEDVSPLTTGDTTANYNRSSGSHMAMTVDSNDTTVRLYRKYQAHIFDLPALDLSPTPNPSQTTCSPAGATVTTPNNSPTSDPTPHSALRPSPGESLGRLDNASTGGSRTQSMFLSMPTRESLLYPKPLRVQSIRAEAKHTSLHSGIAVSGTGMTTDSEDDPFRYDKDAYRIFLHPSKERDISTALNHISGLSSHSQATMHGSEGDAAVRKVSLRPPPISKGYIDDDPFFSGPTRARSPTPESADGFYDTSVIQPNWAVEQSAYEVKVVLQDVSRNNSMNANSSRQKNQNNHDGAPEKINRSSLIKPVQVGSLSCRRDKENLPSSERDDWETVATSAAGLRSMQLPPPLPRASMPGMESRGIKFTGSSVADVSDDESFCHVPFDEYASTDRIVQHPSGHEDSEESLQIRNFSGTKVPVMIPKQRVHRVNGFPQNASRKYSPSQLPGSDAAAAFAKKVSSPFRQLSGSRSRRFSPTPFHPLPCKLEKGKGRFEFRNYSQASDSSAMCPKHVYEFKGVSSDTGHTQSEAVDLTHSDVPDYSGGDPFSLRDSGSSQSSEKTTHSFAFPLIPLPEAARLQAVQRTSILDEVSNRRIGTKQYMTKEHTHTADQPHHRSPTTFFTSMFAPSSTESSYRPHNRLKKSRAIPNNLTMQSTASSTEGEGTWTTFFPFGSNSTRLVGPSHILKTAATRLHLDDLGRRFQQRKVPSFTIGSNIISRSNTPRLYPWDYPARRRQRERETDPELRAIALVEQQRNFRASRHRNMLDLERAGLPLDPEAFLSWESRHRRRVWFHCMLLASVFPFISVMVYLGKFDSGLSWFTRGEINRLNGRQRRIIFLVMILQFVLWPIVLALVIWRTQQLANETD